jgi:hypothetical protein
MKFLREPLVHFLLLGALLFGVFALAGRWTNERPDRIVITPGLIENLQLGFTRSAQRAPTAAELDAVIEDYIREEVLDREAVARGLDRDDPVIRRRLREKMEFFTEDSVATAEPTDAQLNDFLQKNPEAFRKQGHLPELAEVREAVQRAWLAASRKQTNDEAYRKLREHYTVVVQRPAPGAESGSKPEAAK